VNCETKNTFEKKHVRKEQPKGITLRINCGHFTKVISFDAWLVKARRMKESFQLIGNAPFELRRRLAKEHIFQENQFLIHGTRCT